MSRHVQLLLPVVLTVRMLVSTVSLLLKVVQKVGTVLGRHHLGGRETAGKYVLLVAFTAEHADASTRFLLCCCLGAYAHMCSKACL